MNFFRSILSEDLDPPGQENPQKAVPKLPTSPSEEHDEYADDDDDDDEHSDQRSPSPEELSSNPDSAGDGGGGGWSFGGLIKTLATRSESVIETYRRDLKEFGSGLQKETETIREAASRAVKELPASIEVGASVAQGSLQTVGQAIDGVLKSTAEIISHGKDNLLAPSDGESDSETHNHSKQSLSSKRYSRFDSQLSAIKGDANTYCEEPEDLDDYHRWKLGFVLDDMSDEVKSLIEENGTIEGIYKRVVPNVVDHETFWCRYFYRVHKLKQQEDMRANLVRRAISIDLDEELSWDVEDDEEDAERKGQSKGNTVTPESKDLVSKELLDVVKDENATDEAQIGSSEVVEENVQDVAGSKKVLNEEVPPEQTSQMNNAEKKSEEEVKVNNGDSGKDSDVSIVSTQPSSPEEEELGWDEIEDTGSNDGNNMNRAGSPNRTDLQKRLSAADEEDLSWDIEDGDEPVTKPDTK